MYTLVLQSFGRENEYRRAILTVLSFYAYTRTAEKKSGVLLFTDKPAFFLPYFKGLPVQYVTLTPEKIARMRGAIDFLHRMKIAVIEEAFQLIGDDMLYADSDTFFTSDPAPLMALLTPGKSFMHKWEYCFDELRNWKLPMARTFWDFLHLIETKKFTLPNGQKLEVTPQHSSWNAGVMMFHHAQKSLIPDVYALTEQFYPSSKNHASEQYAFSIVLQENTQLLPCEKVICHYWYNIKKRIIDQFLAEKFTNEWSNQALEQKLSEVKGYTIMLPGFFEEHALTRKDNAIQAFNEDDIIKGYQWTFKSLLKQPFKSGDLLKDALYHTKRYLKSKI